MQANTEGAWEDRYSDGHFYEVLVLERSKVRNLCKRTQKLPGKIDTVMGTFMKC